MYKQWPIKIPLSVISIGYNAFSDCTGLTSVIFENKTGWKARSTTITEEQLTDPTTAATLLKSTYAWDQWRRS